MAITSIDQLLAGALEKPFSFNKVGPTTITGAWFSLWAATGNPGPGSLSIGNTTTGDIPDNSLAGSWPFTNPTGGDLTYLMRWAASSGVAATLYLIDRCWHAGSFTCVNGTINATDSTPVDRPASGEGVELWAEIASALSATACTLTVTYVNQDGVGGRTATCTLVASSTISRMYPFALQAGDTGVQQIENVAGSAAPTGSFNLVLLRKLAVLNLGAVGVGAAINPFSGGMPRVYDDSCLAMMILASTTTAVNIDGQFRLAQG